jgi:hypothetical protein
MLKAVIFILLAGLATACGENVVFRTELVFGLNLIKNGSFEDTTTFGNNAQNEPIVGGVKLICGGSSSLTNWSVTRLNAKTQDCSPYQQGGASNTVGWFSSQNIYEIGAHDGMLFLNLFSCCPRPVRAQIAQTVQTSQGYDYTLLFWIGSTTKFGTEPSQIGTDLGIQVDVVDTETGHTLLSEKVAAENPASGLSDWQPSTWRPSTQTRFTASGSQTTISFAADGGGNAVYVGLDDVQLYCKGPPGFFFIGGC